MEKKERELQKGKTRGRNLHLKGQTIAGPGEFKGVTMAMRNIQPPCAAGEQCTERHTAAIERPVTVSTAMGRFFTPRAL